MNSTVSNPISTPLHSSLTPKNGNPQHQDSSFFQMIPLTSVVPCTGLIQLLRTAMSSYRVIPCRVFSLSLSISI
jgi:hypothetical protein